MYVETDSRSQSCAQPNAWGEASRFAASAARVVNPPGINPPVINHPVTGRLLVALLKQMHTYLVYSALTNR